MLSVSMRRPREQGASGKGCSICGQDFPIREACSTKYITLSLESRWSVDVSPSVVLQQV